jgi:hypothetical protein
MTQASDQPSFFTYPDNKVIAVLPNMRAARAASDALRDAGAKPGHIELIQGAEAADNLDINGTEHGAFGVTFRFFQNLLDGEGQTYKEYYGELKRGFPVIAVHADTRDDALLIRDLLKAQGGRHAFYYTPLTVETLIE